MITQIKQNTNQLLLGLMTFLATSQIAFAADDEGFGSFIKTLIGWTKDGTTLGLAFGVLMGVIIAVGTSVAMYKKSQNNQGQGISWGGIGLALFAAVIAVSCGSILMFGKKSIVGKGDTLSVDKVQF